MLWERFLQPGDVQGLERRHHIAGIVQRIGGVRVRQNNEIGKRLADRLQAGDILPAALAVDRFMKLMHAIIRIKMAIMEKSLTYSILPPDCMPFT